MFSTRHPIRLGRILGVPVEIAPTWILLTLLVLWSFWERYATGFGHRSTGVAVAMALVATVVFLGSVLLHEVGHALVGRMRGMRQAVITLYLFGGATNASDPAGPADEFLMTLAGPSVNLLLALGLWGVQVLATHGRIDAVAQVAGEAAWLNLLLGAFNLVPASPLDGGRILEAVVCRVTKSRPQAIRVGAAAGAGLGALLMSYGLLEMLLVRGGLIGGLWFGLIGYMLLEGARGERTRAWLEQVVRGRPARILLTEHAEPVTPDTSVGWLVGSEFVRHHVDAVPVEQNGETLGVVLAEDALGVPAGERFYRTAADVMRPLSEVPTARGDEDALDALHRLGDHPVLLLVDGHGRVHGAISRRQVGMALDRVGLAASAGITRLGR